MSLKLFETLANMNSSKERLEYLHGQLWVGKKNKCVKMINKAKTALYWLDEIERLEKLENTSDDIS